MIGDGLDRCKAALPSPGGGISAQVGTLRTAVTFVDLSPISSPFVRFQRRGSGWLLPFKNICFFELALG